MVLKGFLVFAAPRRSLKALIAFKSNFVGIIVETEAIKIQTPFVFEKLDWPAAEEALASLKAKTPQALVHGLPGSAKAFLLAWFYQKLQEKNPWLILTPTREEALLLQDDIASWLPQVP